VIELVNNQREIQLIGQVIFRFCLETQTGLHIGAGATSMGIGTVENTVLRDPLTNRPYIPGSSLKGKMRSLAERYYKKALNQQIGNTYIHSCGAEYKDKKELEEKGWADYVGCEICPVFGVPGERPFSQPTRLIVRDIPLSKESADELEHLETDSPFTEVKIEVSIDRITSQANPRHIERVPAGVKFGPGEMIYSLYDAPKWDLSRDFELIDKTLITSMDLLEKDYLGGMGSRGYGKVAFKNIKVIVRLRTEDTPPFREETIREYDDLPELLHDRSNLIKAIKDQFGSGGSCDESGSL